MPYNYKTDLHRYRRYYQSIGAIAAKPKSRVLTAAIFSFLAVSLFGWYAIRPTIQTILYLRREIEDKKRVNKQMEEKITNLIVAHTTYQNIKEDLPLLTEALPKRAEILDAIDQIRTITAIHSASVSSVTSSSSPILSSAESLPTSSPSPQKINQSDVQSIGLSLSVHGPYEAIAATVDAMLSMRRLVTLDTISYTLAKDKDDASPSGSPSLAVVMKLNAHYIDSK